MVETVETETVAMDGMVEMVEMITMVEMVEMVVLFWFLDVTKLHKVVRKVPAPVPAEINYHRWVGVVDLHQGGIK